ncbi:hypothetical protein SAMN05661109_02204, partial [Corynebacterium cystitidis DSM 20524]
MLLPILHTPIINDQGSALFIVGSRSARWWRVWQDDGRWCFNSGEDLLQRRGLSVVASVVCAGVLSACSGVLGGPGTVTVPEQGTTEHGAGTEAGAAGTLGEASHPVAPKADAFPFDSGSIRIGPFDPDELYPDVFDPCQEISTEEIEERGFTTDGITMSEGSGSLLGCTFIAGPQHPKIVFTVYGNLASKQDHIDGGVYSHEVESDVLDGVFEYVMETDGPRM